MPVVLLDRDNRFRFVNHAGEQFLGISAAQLANLRLSDLVPADSPIFMLIAQVRSPGRGYGIRPRPDIGWTPHALRKQGITVQATPLSEGTGRSAAGVFRTPRRRARWIKRQLTFRSAARSVTGMAAILAHEVKNPLSGIRGAAQLLESSVAEPDRELTVLIRDEADRIRDLVDRMEMFSAKPIERGAVNIHRVLEHVRRLAQSRGSRARHPHF